MWDDVRKPTQGTLRGLVFNQAERTMYQRKVDVDMLNAVKSVLADVSSVSPLSEQRAFFCSDEGLTLETSANTLYGVQHIHINLTLIHCTFYRHTKTSSHRD